MVVVLTMLANTDGGSIRAGDDNHLEATHHTDIFKTKSIN